MISQPKVPEFELIFVLPGSQLEVENILRFHVSVAEVAVGKVVEGSQELFKGLIADGFVGLR
jgi:hypothetical protein